MTDNPKDPMKSGSRLGPGSQAGKRPAATIDLQATEIERRDISPDQSDSTEAEAAKIADAPQATPETGAAAADTAAKASVGNETLEAVGNSAAAEPAPAKPAMAAPASRQAARRASGVSGFVSHLLAGAAGAGLAIFGADYLANTVGLSLPTYSAAQVDQLTRRIGVLEQGAADHSNDPAAALLREQLDALRVKVEQTAAAATTLDSVQTEQKQLEERTAKLDQLLTAQPPASATTGRIAKLEDQFKMLAQSGAAGQGGNAGTMAALIAKVDAIGADLDSHLGETRKSLQLDMQKQSAHFEDRLSEVDKGMSVDTLKATGKTLSDQIVTLKADADKLRQDIATVAAGNRQLRQDLAALQQATTDLKTQVTADAGTFAKSQQLSDVNATAAKLQSDLAVIAARDQSREQSAGRIMLALELGNLKRAVERGGAYVNELAEVKRLAPKTLDLTALEAGAEKGLPTNSLLTSEFKDLTWSILNADSKPSGDGSLLGQLWQGARSVVQVRRTGDVAGDGTEAILARAETRLLADDLDGTLREVAQLKGDARKAAELWMAKLASRLAVDQAMSEVEAGLAKLMGPAGGSAAPSSTN